MSLQQFLFAFLLFVMSLLLINGQRPGRTLMCVDRVTCFCLFGLVGGREQDHVPDENHLVVLEVRVNV